METLQGIVGFGLVVFYTILLEVLIHKYTTRIYFGGLGRGLMAELGTCIGIAVVLTAITFSFFPIFVIILIIAGVIMSKDKKG